MTGFVRQSLPALVRSALPDAVYEGELPDVRVTGVTYDSRQLQAGFVFVAFQGYSVDGHRYIPQAVERGAIAVVGTEDLHNLEVPYIRVADLRAALAALAAAFYDHPANQMTMIGITGHRWENHHGEPDLPHPAGGGAARGDDLYGQRGDWQRGDGHGLPRDHAGSTRSAALPHADAGRRVDPCGARNRPRTAWSSTG